MMSCWSVHLKHKNKKQQFMKIKAGRKIFLPQTVDKYGSELSTHAAIFLPYKVICILFSHKNYFSHVQVALVASSYGWQNPSLATMIWC